MDAKLFLALEFGISVFAESLKTEYTGLRSQAKSELENYWAPYRIEIYANSSGAA